MVLVQRHRLMLPPTMAFMLFFAYVHDALDEARSDLGIFALTARILQDVVNAVCPPDPLSFASVSLYRNDIVHLRAADGSGVTMMLDPVSRDPVMCRFSPIGTQPFNAEIGACGWMVRVLPDSYASLRKYRDWSLFVGSNKKHSKKNKPLRVQRGFAILTRR